MRSRTVLTLAISTLIVATTTAFGTAKGTMLYTGQDKPITTTFTHAFLIKGPDVVDQKKMLRRVLLTTADIGAKLKACETMACVDDAFAQGLQVDWDAGPRLNYWLTLNDQLVQFSGTLEPRMFVSKEDSPKRIAGKLTFDGTPASGPKVDVEFDAPLVKEIVKVR
ncbi:MAG TPA: hypothetical protein VES67_26590 [Vicinamibacterales bacterium]|nr:hypothetical protein [Vicinamibacterales bacterium]